MNRLRGFDGLRAVAALAIVVLHVTASTGASVHGPLSNYFARLDAGVAIFFVISGFLLYRPFVAAHLDVRSGVDVRRFYGRRFLRIYPAYWIALTFVIVVFRSAHLHGIGAYVQHYSLMQIYNPRVLLAGIIPAWTLAVEVSFYLLLPAYAALLARMTRARPLASRVRIELGAAVAVWLLALGGRAVLGAVAQAGTDTYQLKWLPFMADWFALGLVLAIGQVAYHSGHAGPRLGRGVETVDRAPVLVAAAGVLAFVAVANIGLPTSFSAGTVAQDVVRQALYGIMAMAFVAVAAWSVRPEPAPGAVVRRGLDARVMVLIGTVSYGLFLWHYDIIGLLERWHFAEHFTRATTAALLVVVLVAALAVAAVSWIVVERPLLRSRRSPVEGREPARR